MELGYTHCVKYEAKNPCAPGCGCWRHMKRPWIQSPEARATRAANRAARYAQYELACQVPTTKYPNGRTGTEAGFKAHVGHNQEPCQECRTSTNQAVYAKRDPAKRAGQRMYGKYGMTKSMYEAILGTQDGKCAICRNEAERYTIDHDHSCCTGDKTCGKCIRGLLCDGCNIGLGHFRDSKDNLRAAIAYLEVHENGLSYPNVLR